MKDVMLKRQVKINAPPIICENNADADNNIFKGKFQMSNLEIHSTTTVTHRVLIEALYEQNQLSEFMAIANMYLAQKPRGIVTDKPVNEFPAHVAKLAVEQNLHMEVIGAIYCLFDGKFCTCPAHGSWISAKDVQRCAREIDIAINGERSAAQQAKLIDVAEQIVGLFNSEPVMRTPFFGGDTDLYCYPRNKIELTDMMFESSQLAMREKFLSDNNCSRKELFIAEVRSLGINIENVP